MEIKRNIFNKLEREIKEPEISILLGARQVGKSTLLRQIEKVAQRRGLKTRYYDLELSSDLEQLSGKPKDVFEELISGAQVVFIDEFHYLENASKIFKAVYDSRKKVKIFASGSSSMEIHKHLKESLAGRFTKTIIYPLSFFECQQIPGFGFEDYCRWGGMPGLIHKHSVEEKMALLENIVSTYLTKDIKALIQEENVRAFNSLLYLIAQSQGSLLSIPSLARETGLSEPTVARHLEIMSQTYVCFGVTSFSQNLANELKKSRKHYLFDIGIRNGLLKDFRPPDIREDKGPIYEAFAFLHLLAQTKPNHEIRFWRTKKGEEVDFILLKDRIPIPIEVKSSSTETAIPKGIRSFLKRYPKAPFGVVLDAVPRQEARQQTTVEGRPVYFRPITQTISLDDLAK